MATPSTAGPNSYSGDRPMGRTIHAALRILKDEANALLGWTAVIGGAVIAFWLSEATSFHQLAVGILLSSGTLFVLMSLVEIIWRTIDSS